MTARIERDEDPGSDDLARWAGRQTYRRWAAWIMAGAPSKQVPSYVTLQMMCSKCGAVLRCMAPEGDQPAACITDLEGIGS